MTRRKRSALAWRIAARSCAAISLLLMGVLGLPGCAVLASDNCLEKANCPSVEDAPGVVPDATIDHTTEPGGDDGAAAPPDDGTVIDATEGGGGNVASEASTEGGAVDDAGREGGDADAAPRDGGADGLAETGTTPPDASESLDAADAANATPDASPEAGGACDPLAPDCSSAACARAFSCIPSVPAGWLGPAVLFDLMSSGVPAPAPPACPGGPQYATVAFDGHDNASPQGTCSCTCGTPAGTCNGPTITIYHGGTCASQCQNVPAVTTACARGCANSDALSAAVTAAPTPAGGTCSASLTNGLVPFDPTDWTTTGRVCAASRAVTQGGCATNQVCADAPPATTLQAWCVYQTGTVACPAGYAAPHVLFSGATDTRTCAGTCACAAATGMACSVDSVSVSATTDCAAPALFMSTGLNQCNQNLAVTARNVTASVTASGGSCAPSGTASVTGGVTPTGPTTVCCTQ